MARSKQQQYNVKRADTGEWTIGCVMYSELEKQFYTSVKTRDQGEYIMKLVKISKYRRLGEK